MIKVHDLAFSYSNTEVLKHISLEILPGKIYGLLGENGVGKTTLLTLLAGLKKPQQGSKKKNQPKDEHKDKRASTTEAGRVGNRPYARGRAYSENHYEE